MTLKKYLKQGSAVIVCVAAAACGQNANLSRPDAGGAIGADGAGALAGSNKANGLKADDTESAKAPEAEVTNPAYTARLARNLKISDGLSLTGIDPAYRSTVIMMAGKDGANGRDGKDGISIKGDKGDKGDPGAAGPAGRDGRDGVNGINGKDGKDGLSVKGDKGDPGPAGKDGKDAVAAAIAPPAVVVGKDGKDGKDGAAGCGLEPRTYKALGVKMEPTEYSAAELPLVTTKRHPIGLKNIGGATKTSRQGVAYVKDAQVLFKLPLALPPRESIKSIRSAFIVMNVSKLSKDGHPGTEFVCFLDEKVCSGQAYTADEKSWQANINQAFWGNLGRNLSTDFSIELNAEKVGRVAGMTLWHNEAFQIKLENLAKDSKFADPALGGDELTNLIYQANPTDKPLERSFRMVVGDDTFVKSAELNILVDEDTCKTQQLVQGKSE